MSREPGRHDVVITGVGLHGAHGDGPATLAALRAGRSAVAPYRTPEADGFPEVAGAPAAPFDLAELVPDRKLHESMSRAAALAVVAAGRALRDAQLLDDAPRREGLALFAATGLAGLELDQVTGAMSVPGEGLGGDRIAQGLARSHPLLPLRMLPNMPLALVSIAYGLKGENAVLYPGPLQGGAALRMAYDAVASGRCARALVGGSVHGLALMPLATALRAGRLPRSPEAAAHREGGRGAAATDAAAFVVLESADAARDRGLDGRALLTGLRIDPVEDAVGPIRRNRTGAPGLVVVTGTVDGERDAADQRLAAHANLVRLDPLAGHAGPAAPATAVGLAALAIADRTGPGVALAVARDPDGGVVVATLADVREVRP